MNPRLDGIESRCIRPEREIFDLDITKYEEAFRVEEYLSREFKESYKYPLRSVVFHPRHGVNLRLTNLTIYFLYNLIIYLDLFRATNVEHAQKYFNGKKKATRNVHFGSNFRLASKIPFLKYGCSFTNFSKLPDFKTF